jgi:hypothetical protein
LDAYSQFDRIDEDAGDTEPRSFERVRSSAAALATVNAN